MAFANPSRSLFGTGDTINMLPVLIPSRLASSGTLLAISPRRIASAAMDELAPAFILAVVALFASAETLAILGFWLYPSIFAAIVLALVLAPNRWEEAASNLPILIACAAVHIVSVPSASCCTRIVASAPVMRVPCVHVSFTAGRVTPDMGLHCHLFFHWHNIDPRRLSGCRRRSSSGFYRRVSSRRSLARSFNAPWRLSG